MRLKRADWTEEDEEIVDKGYQIYGDRIYVIRFKNKKVDWIEHHYLIEEAYNGVYGTYREYKKGDEEEVDKAISVLEEMVREGNLPKEFIENGDL